jgi:hypothetical protein
VITRSLHGVLSETSVVRGGRMPKETESNLSRQRVRSFRRAFGVVIGFATITSAVIAVLTYSQLTAPEVPGRFMTIGDTIQGGAWTLAAPVTGPMLPASNPPKGAIEFVPFGARVSVTCALWSAAYPFTNGITTETWHWWARTAAGTFIQMAEFQGPETDGPYTLPPCQE